jgi:peptidoglycan/LPS O-acetylase OafA/YrhL
MTQVSGASTRLVHLDMLRGLAALAVVAGHARGFVFVDYDAAGTSNALMKAFYFLTGLGHQAVIAFFALSGFLVGGKAFEAISAGVWSFPNYLIARLSRLWTVALPALALTLCLDSLGVSLTNGVGYDGTLYGPLASGPPSGAGIDLSLTTLAGNVAFLQTIAVPTYGSNGPLWSLANEFWYYVIFPLFAVAVAAPFTGTTRAISAAAAVAIALALPRDLVALGAIWVAGALAYVAWQRTGLARRAAHPVTCLLAAAAAAVLIVLSRSDALALPPLVQDLMLGLAFAVLLPGLAVLAPGPRAYRGVASGLSEISYTLYATHFPILAVLWFTSVAPRQFPPDAASLALWGGMVATSILAAAVLWWCFERHTPAVRRLTTRAFGMTRDADARAT